MTDDAQLIQSPEERELDRKRDACAGLNDAVAERELDLATMRTELRVFQMRYFRAVGARLAELDELEACIAEIFARSRPDDLDAAARASMSRARASESAAALALSTGPYRARRSNGLRELYLEVAKRVHPDLALEHTDRARREALMAEANAAYEAGDEARLRAVLVAWVSDPEAVAGEGVAADLVRVIRRIAQMENRVRTIDAEIASLAASDLFRLMKRVQDEESRGLDPIEAMSRRANDRVSDARARLATARARGA